MSQAHDTSAATAEPAVGPHRVGAFGRLASWSQRHRWGAVLLWVLLLAAITVGSQAAGSDYRNDFSLPGTDSQAAADLMRAHGSPQAGDSVQIVFSGRDGLRAERDGHRADARPGARAAERRGRPQPVRGRLRRLRGRHHRLRHRHPHRQGRRTSPSRTSRAIMDTARAAETDGLRIEIGGDAVRGAEEEGGGAEGAGMLAALVVLVLLFGSLVAAALPLVTALFAVGGAIGLIALASHVFTVADFTPPIMMLVGLGVGVDYALLIFYRYRHELTLGADPRTATRTALDSAGRTVFFAGCTVIIALLGLVALGLGSLQGVALAVALTVLVTMAASLVLLPALLGLLGGRIQRQVRRRAARARAKGRQEGRRWRALASAVQRRPLPALLAAVVALLALSAPALGMRLGFADAGNDPETSTGRQAYDLMAEGFGPGFNGPLVVVSRGDATAATALRATLANTDGIAATTPPLPSADGAVSTVIAFPTTSPQDAGTTALVRTLRDDVLPGLGARTGAEYLVGGPTAATQDFAASVAARMPLFVAIVVGLSALLLMVVFRSVLIPIKAALLNLLSIAAALGAITLVFQDGRFGAQPGPIEAFIPVMIFAIVFGLSMDYEVFLLSRIHEEWERTRDHSHAVREGVAATGKVITAAAAIMIVVFAAFVLSPSRMLQQFGLGLAVAILLDAVVIRCLIVPAVMQLLGRHAWWLPSGLARRLPRVALERPSAG